jgi:hypothetical protein
LCLLPFFLLASFLSLLDRQTGSLAPICPLLETLLEVATALGHLRLAKLVPVLLLLRYKWQTVLPVALLTAGYIILARPAPGHYRALPAHPYPAVPPLGSQAAKLCSQMGLAASESAILTTMVTRLLVGPTFAKNLVATNPVVRTQPQPGSKMVLGLLFAHIPSQSADDGHRNHHIDAVSVRSVPAMRNKVVR